jgi:hypothetical protein
MLEAHLDETVKLTQDIPELGLRRGDLGLVCSTWPGHASAYEVEFRAQQACCPVRALLLADQIEKQCCG